MHAQAGCFSRRCVRAHEYNDCKIVVCSGANAYDCSYQQEILLCDCPAGCEHCIQLGGCQQRVQFASKKAATRSSRTPQIKQRDDNGRRQRPPAPLRRRELRARSAARRPVPRYRWRQLSPTTPGLRAIAATLASESRRWQTRSMGRGALADAPPRPNNANTQAWSRASSANAATTPVWCGRTRSSRALS